MQYAVILNPGSNGGRSRRSFDRVLSALDQSGVDYHADTTASLDDAYTLSREANQAGVDAVVAVGGDGTINRVLNGFYDADGRRVSSRTAMAVLYTGTSPDFCKSYGIPLDLDKAVRSALRRSVRRVTVGRIAYAVLPVSVPEGETVSAVKETRTGFFACCANVGMGPLLARYANSGIRKHLGDKLGTFVALMRLLITYHPCAYRVRIDGREVVFDKVFNLFVGRTRHVASGIKVSAGLTPEDPRLYALAVSNLRAANVVPSLRTLYGGRRITDSDVFTLRLGRCTEILATSNNPGIEFDGDPAGFLPCRIDTAADPLDLVCGDGHAG